MKKVIIILALFNLYQYSYAQDRQQPVVPSLQNIVPPSETVSITDNLAITDTVPPVRDTLPPLKDSVRRADSLLQKEIQDSIRRADSLLQKEVSSADSLDLQKAANRTDTIVLPVDTALQAIPVHIEAGAIDSLPVDSLAKPRIKTPRGATIRSAIIPGWGQAYNNRYWKIPIVYGALGTTAAVFSYNLRYYKKIRFAYTTLINKDSANFGNVAPELQPFINNNDIASLRLNRNTFRKNIDYSVLFFLFFWGLNVLDATVDAHLKGFNVNDDLSLKVKPLLNTNSAGLSLVLDIHKAKPKPLFNNFY